MKKTAFIIGLSVFFILSVLYVKRKFYSPPHLFDNAKKEIKNGDLIFQASLSQQSKAIQVATHSKYSHCGLIFKDGNNLFVFEAVEPVKWLLLGVVDSYN
jgi:hypothetical protein